MGWGEEEKKEKERKRELRERRSTLSLNFQAIRSVVSGEARGKVHPRRKIFALRPESGSFDKLQEVGVFLLLGLVFARSH